MKLRIVKKSLVALFGLIAILYLAQLLMNTGSEIAMTNGDLNTARHGTIAVFGATGTIGDGLLKAAMNDPDVDRIHVVTRRPSPRIEEGVDSGKVTMTIHKDYLDYAAIRNMLAEVKAVYWAIGLSAVGLDEGTYREIHAEYPLRFVAEWLSVRDGGDASFHYISGGGANEGSRMMWAREKARAENELAKLAQDTNMRVVSYRPAFVTPTEAEATVWHSVLHAILAPIEYAVRAESIGQAMLEVSARGRQLENGTILENKDIVAFSRAYEERRGTRTANRL